ncbi:MAG TPA: nicotinate-nicotinamide nucleotide adenylyltransferase, partial [Thermoguttaceae bacterium]|nr:nicotinate-nicotinamide nucleotide adenylyltransferase [Thermoguttaceae bacterium]
GGHEPFEVNPYEIDRGGTSYTVDTLRHFHQTRPDDELFLLLGADMLADLPNWRESGEICRLALPVAVHRPGAGEVDLMCLAQIATPERISQMRDHQVEMPQIDLSSTELRRRVAAGQSIRFQTPRAVEEYLCEHGLYRQQP